YTTPDRRGFLDQLVAAIFLDLNHQAEIVVDTAPSGHSLMLASQGADDGLAMRVEGLEDTYPNLIRVPESVAHSDFVAMSRRHVFSPVGWSSLAPFKVSFLSGWAIFENRVPAEVSARPVDRVEHMIQLLHQGQVDVLLYERWQGLVMA
ncbi:hypothetical protein RZS08_16460, partial [Arthrospira platensis SPKY1]|nr:hypothetical protein [Arthrospira platensis SPKY1]